MMKRRNFLKETGFLLGGAALLPRISKAEHTGYPDLDSWTAIRDQFQLDSGYIHMAMMLLSSHPAPVREEIEKHRRAFDRNPVEYWEHNFMEMEPRMSSAAAAYINAEPEEIALTDSTSMGLGILYSGFRLKPGDEVLTTVHDHYATEKSLEFAAQKNGAAIRKIILYKDPATVTMPEVVENITKAITPATRVVAVTWVHSSTGVKLPVREIGIAIKTMNEQRSAANRIYFCVDGVHGFGVEDIDIKKMGCDFFAAGTHKWIFGPRGTGILYGKKDAWPMVIPTIPSFTGLAYGIWLGVVPETPLSFRDLVSPGGFHSFEHRWSLHKAFEFHQQIGKPKVASRTHQLSTLLKEGLQPMKHIKLKTPVSPALSSGINCFEIAGIKPEEAVQKLLAKKIIGSSSPYRVSYVRLTPSIVNNEDEVKTCLQVLENMRG